MVALAAPAEVYDARDELNRAFHGAGLPDSATVQAPSFLTAPGHSQVRQRLEAGQGTPALSPTEGAWTPPLARDGFLDPLGEAGYDSDLFVVGAPGWRRCASVPADGREATGATAGYGLQLRDYVGRSCCTFREVLARLGGGHFGSPADHATGPVGERPVTATGAPLRDALRVLRGLVYGSGADHAADLPRVTPEAAAGPRSRPASRSCAVPRRTP